MTRKKIQILLNGAKLPEAIKEMGRLLDNSKNSFYNEGAFEDPALEKDFGLLSYRFHQNEEQNKKGIIKSEDYVVEKNRISQTAIDLLEKFPEDMFPKKGKEQNQETSKNPTKDEKTDTETPSSKKWLQEHWKIVSFASLIAVILIVGTSLLSFSCLFRNPVPQTVFIHGSEGKGDKVIQNKGILYLESCGKEYEAKITKGGVAYFEGIPACAIGKKATFWISGTLYTLVNEDKIILQREEAIYLEAKLKGGDHIFGIVTDKDGDPLAGVRVSVKNDYVLTDKSGSFKLNISKENQSPNVEVIFFKGGYKLDKNLKTPTTAPDNLEIVLYKRKS